LEDTDLFDAGFFGFNSREAEGMDPQIGLFLESAWTALERAGYDALQFPGRIGVFAGSAMSTDYTCNSSRTRRPCGRAGAGMSSLGVFNDRDSLTPSPPTSSTSPGPPITVQSLCSTSLVAVHLACQTLVYGESDMALAGAPPSTSSSRAVTSIRSPGSFAGRPTGTRCTR
jgi:acyl transferase domain-containing protein